MLCIARRCGGVQVAGLRSQSPLTPDHRFFSRIYSPLTDELRMVTVRRCGRSRILAARFTFVPHPIRPVTCATLLYIRGVVWNMVLFHFGSSCRFPLCAVDSSTPVDYRTGVCVQVSVGSSTVLAPSASRRYQVGHSRHALFLSRFFYAAVRCFKKSLFYIRTRVHRCFGFPWSFSLPTQRFAPAY